MTYRTDEIEFTESWDVVQWGPETWKIEVGKRRSSPIAAPREVITKLRLGQFSTPLKLDVESGKTYVLLGDHKRTTHSIVGRDVPVMPRTSWERVFDWVRWELLPALGL